MTFTFEWDMQKAKENFEKHKVSFEEAITVFFDPLEGVIVDPRHASEEETRYISVGYSSRHRVLVVVYCDRGDRIRVISARQAMPRERKRYEEKTN